MWDECRTKTGRNKRRIQNGKKQMQSKYGTYMCGTVRNGYGTNTRRKQGGYGTGTLMRRQHAPIAAPGASARRAAPADAS